MLSIMYMRLEQPRHIANTLLPGEITGCIIVSKIDQHSPISSSNWLCYDFLVVTAQLQTGYILLCQYHSQLRERLNWPNNNSGALVRRAIKTSMLTIGH